MTFRFARHTNNLERIAKFYTEILGFEILGEFKDHNDYDGVFLGLHDSDWHLEFTKSNEPADHKFDEDDILVFYPSTNAEYKQLKDRIKENKIEKIASTNPYWNNNGTMVLDPDGYRIVISPLRIKRD